MEDKVRRLVEAAKALVKSVSFDENGEMVGTRWVGGHGGLISKETHVKVDQCRRAIQNFEREE
ncbi:MAG TPA: hypothetical protein VF944_04490 [Candidatus Bathyarchaeia archaeon]